MLRNTRITVLSISVFVAASVFSGAVHATTCPSAKTLQDGFTLERPPTRTTVERGEGPVTRVVNIYGNGREQTVLYFRGLIELYRMTRNSHILRYPQTDLAELFPLKRGDRHTFSYIETTPEDVPGALRTVNLEVLGTETFTLGPCRYEALVIERVFKREDAETGRSSVLYSPELETILARRYDAGTAQEATIGYSKIGPMQ